MTTIFLIILFITQVISFYLIALLHMKLAKFDDLEKKQNRLMQEMDDSLAVYLAEIKDENDQLLEKLTIQVNENHKAPEFETAIQKEQTKRQSDIEAPVQVTPPQHTMRHHARKTYAMSQQNNVAGEKKDEVAERLVEDDRTRVLQLSDEGLSTEEIAKELNKGRTEVELILKFK